eukprot:3807558-Karenia_brevis.AAC.1
MEGLVTRLVDEKIAEWKREKTELTLAVVRSASAEVKAKLKTESVYDKLSVLRRSVAVNLLGN